MSKSGGAVAPPAPPSPTPLNMHAQSQHTKKNFFNLGHTHFGVIWQLWAYTEAPGGSYGKQLHMAAHRGSRRMCFLRVEERVY